MLNHSKQKYKITVAATTGRLAEVRNFVAKNAQKCGFSKAQTSDVRLAVDEAFTNIIEHAYSKDKTQKIELELECNGKSLRVSLYDTGKSFNEKDYQKPDIKKRMKQKKRGGVGVYLIKQLMDEVNYNRHADFNEIRMIKKR